jgi:hypothetical protein
MLDGRNAFHGKPQHLFAVDCPLTGSCNRNLVQATVFTVQAWRSTVRQWNAGLELRHFNIKD